MKKRLSLLMVLMMVLSLVPMSAFAASATVPNGSFSVDDTEKTTEQVTVKLTQAEGTKIETTNAQVKLTLNKGEFAKVKDDKGDPTDKFMDITVKTKLDDGKPSVDATATVNFADDDIAYLQISQTKWELNKPLEDDLFIYLTFSVDLDEEDAGDVTLAVDEINDSNLEVSKPILIGIIEEGTSDDMTMTVKDDTTKIGFDGGELSRVTLSDIDEAANDKETVRTLELELPDYLNWDLAKTVMSIGAQPVTLTAANLNTDKDMLTIDVTGFDITQDLTVTPYVDVDQRDASTGDLSLKITARDGNTKLDTVDEVIGALVEFDVTISAVEKGEKVIPALYGGDDATIKVTLDGVEGSFTAGRDIDFTITGADIVGASFNLKSDFASVDFDEDGENVDDGEFTLKVKTPATGETVGDSLEFEMEINTDYATNGPVVLTAESRDFSTLEVDVATVTPAYTVTVEKTTAVKKGEALATADIIIKEAKAGMFDTDQYLVLSLNDANRNTMSFASDYKLDMTNGLDADDDLYDEEGNSKSDLNNLVLEITSSSSKEAGMITISNVLVSVDGAAVDGIKTLDTYLVDNGDDNGLADGSVTNVAKDKDYVKVSDDATAVEYALDEDADLDADYSVDYVNVVKEYGTVATTTVFKIGSKAYTVNGEAMTANEAPFIAGKGYTMLPVRALAESLGLTANWNNATKTATFSNASKIASVVIGADMMYVNGTPLTLNAKAEIKNGSTFIELRSIANAFGTELQWDAATKMVTIVG